MSFVGEATGVFGLLEKAWNLLRDRLDPARAQAKRLIETFEAYGIARQQIPRLLPAELKLPNAAFSTPDKLKDKLTPELLDWTAGHLAISRSWLDHVSRTPHLIVDHYKATSGYRDWLSKRLEIAPNVHRFLFVWKPLDEDLPTAHGPLCLIYQEISDGLDGAEFTRYWLLSDQWCFGHPPCVHNLVASYNPAPALITAPVKPPPRGAPAKVSFPTTQPAMKRMATAYRVASTARKAKRSHSRACPRPSTRSTPTNTPPMSRVSPA